MFEDFIRFQAKNYRGEPPDNECTRLGRWLQDRSLEKLLPSTLKNTLSPQNSEGRKGFVAGLLSLLWSGG